MGLYLAVFDGDVEIEGVEVGSYGDFGDFRDTVVETLEAGVPGSRFPTLILHPDGHGRWSPLEAARLEEELTTIGRELKTIPSVRLTARWKQQLATLRKKKIESLYDTFFDVDGEPLVDRLAALASLSRERQLPILFQ